MALYKGLLFVGALMVIAICTDATKSRTKSTRVSDLCSQGYTCKLKSRTRQKIESDLDDNGVSFDDCLDKCSESLRGMSRSRKCECYCSMFHDPCPTEQPTVNDTSIMDEQFQCFNTLAETCSQNDLEKSKSVRTKTFRKLLDIDVNVTSEDCEEECAVELLAGKDRTRSKTITRGRLELSISLCSCFCFYHQVCVPAAGQTTGTTPVTPPVTPSVMPVTEVESTSDQTDTVVLFDLPQ